MRTCTNNYTECNFLCSTNSFHYLTFYLFSPQSAKPTMTEKQVEDMFIRYDVRALPVVDDNNDVIGLVTYKEVAAAKQRLWNKEQKRIRQEVAATEKAKKRGIKEGGKNNSDEKKNERKLGSALKGWMKQHVQTVEAGLTMAEVEAYLLENDVGSIPVVADGTNQLVGMVTRTDLLRQHRYYPSLHYHNPGFSDSSKFNSPLVMLMSFISIIISFFSLNL